MAVTALLCAMYRVLHYHDVEIRWFLATPVKNIEAVIGTINVLVMVEATRRMVNSVMAIVVGVFILHVLGGKYLPGLLHHPGFAYPRVTEIFYLNLDQGMYGMLTGISATYLILFVLFGAFIGFSGVGDFFNNLAFRIAGKSPGGPAKASVWSSGFFGMVSGIGTANVYTTGTFTIPMMKKYGYSPEFAAGVESAASTGGQYMPPIMEAAAFVMAQTIGVPYVKLILYASISAVLYYISMIFCIHMRAVKKGLRSYQEDIVSWREILIHSYYLSPLAVIIIMLVIGYSPMYAGLAGIITVIASSFLEKGNRFTLSKIVQALEVGVKNTIMVAVACAAAGIIVASISQTGFAVSFVSLIIKLSHGLLFPALLLTAFISLIMGTGMPTTPAYILASSLAAPALVDFGVDIVAAHLFVLYFAKISEVTPPVAICAYAACSISGGDPLKTGIQAQKLAISGYILPIAFVFNIALIAKGPIQEIILAVILAIIGLWLVNASIDAWMYRALDAKWRTLFLILGLGSFLPYYYIAVPMAAIGMLFVLDLRRRQVKDGETPAVAPGNN